MERIKYHIKFLALATGVILVWRGIWELSDMYLTVNNPQLSALLSLLLGSVILFFTDRKLNQLL